MTSRLRAPIMLKRSCEASPCPRPRRPVASSSALRSAISASDKALRAVHLRAFELLGIKHGDGVTLDFDSTNIRSFSSRREGADPTWTKRYTLHPLLCFVPSSEHACTSS